jgi:hypothetical protein
MLIRRFLILALCSALLLAQQPNNILPSTSSNVAMSAYNGTAVTSATTVKASAGNVYGWAIYNPNASLCVLQVFNTTSVTLGTTTELLNIPLLATGGSNIVLPYPINFSTAIAVAATTAAHGSSTCASGMIAQVFYQ